MTNQHLPGVAVAVILELSCGRQAKTKDLCRQQGITEATFYNWKAKYAGLKVSEARTLKELEAENSKLKRLLADAELDKAALKDLLAENGRTAGEARSGERTGLRERIEDPVNRCSR